MRHQQKHETLYCKARIAGLEAAKSRTPTPMIVREHVNMLDDDSPVKKQWFVPQGVCGFAWVVISPGTCSFAKWMKKQGLAKRHYYGGMSYWVGDLTFGQSMELKEAYATAFAKVLNENGIKAYSDSRMD